MLIQVQNFWRKNAIFFSILLMIWSMFISRAMFSVATIIFVASCCLHSGFFSQVKVWLRSPVLIAISLLFVIPFISGLWSDDLNEWSKLLRVKLPLLLFPLAFAGNWQLSRQQWKFVLVMILATALAGSAYSLISYLADHKALHYAYLQAKVISTPLESDHLRFSLFIALAFLCSLYLVENGHKALRTIGFCLALWFAVYLHVLSARTGLLCLYVIVIAYVFRLLFYSKSSSFKIILLAFILMMPLAAWFALPTFQNRIRYFVYDHSFARSGTYLPGSNDGNRILSLKAGWHILSENPVGVGAGDVWATADSWYRKNVPGMVPTDKLYPSSEWLMHGAMAGWMGLAVFSVVMFLPFFLRIRHRFFFVMLNLSLLLSLLFDTGLGVQYGVFLYAFYILAFWKWSSNETPIADSF